MEPWGNCGGRVKWKGRGKMGLGRNYEDVYKQDQDTSFQEQWRDELSPISRTAIQNVFTHLVATYHIGWRWEASCNRDPGACFKWEKVNRTWLTDLDKSHQERSRKTITGCTGHTKEQETGVRALRLRMARFMYESWALLKNECLDLVVHQQVLGHLGFISTSVAVPYNSSTREAGERRGFASLKQARSYIMSSVSA